MTERLRRLALVALPVRPDAIVCATDVIGIGVLDGVRLDCRAAVPDAVGVVGFGDIPAASWASHDLATVRLPIERMIDESVRALFTDREQVVDGTILVAADIVWRGSLRQPVNTR